MKFWWGFEWIFTCLRQHYILESRGEHFLDIAAFTFNSDLPYQTYYKQFRASFLDNLRKSGDRLVYKNNLQITADETMTPTLEATIVLWTLERIDPRLPAKVKKNYGHQMVGNQCLVSLQPDDLSKHRIYASWTWREWYSPRRSVQCPEHWMQYDRDEETWQGARTTV